MYMPPPPAALLEPENPENVGTGGGVFGMFQSGGSEEPKEKPVLKVVLVYDVNVSATRMFPDSSCVTFELDTLNS